jgi:hypothetical protein
MAPHIFTPLVVHNEPTINLCCVINDGTCNPITNIKDRGGVLIRGLWEKGIGCILDVRVTVTDAKAYLKKHQHKVLEAAEKLKTRQDLQPFIDQRHYFTPFVLSVDGVIGKEAIMVINVLIQ